MNRRAFFAATLVALGPAAAFDPSERIVSPDRAWAILGSDTAHQLWLEDTRTHRRRTVLDDVTIATMSVSWAPDSSAFAVSDRYASDVEVAYIYDVRTLERVDVRARILAAYPGTARFVPGPEAAPHSYCGVVRWLDAGHVKVRLNGHTDGVRVGSTIRPGDCFDLRFRVGRDGSVRELSRKVLPVSDKGCEEIG